MTLYEYITATILVTGLILEVFYFVNTFKHKKLGKISYWMITIGYILGTIEMYSNKFFAGAFIFIALLIFHLSVKIDSKITIDKGENIND